MVLLSRSAPSHNSNSVHFLAKTAIQKGRLRRRDHLTLTSAMLCNPALSADDRIEINQVLDQVRMGHIELVD